MKEYAVYKGESIVCMGTPKECAEQMGIKLDSFHYYKTPAYKKKVERRKRARNYITVVSIEG